MTNVNHIFDEMKGKGIQQPILVFPLSAIKIQTNKDLLRKEIVHV